MTKTDEWSELDRLAEGATVGPWEVSTTRNGVRIVAPRAPGALGCCKTVCAQNTNGKDKPAFEIALKDLAFAAAARAEVRKLIAEVRRLRATGTPAIIFDPTSTTEEGT